MCDVAQDVNTSRPHSLVVVDSNNPFNIFKHPIFSFVGLLLVILGFVSTAIKLVSIQRDLNNIYAKLDDQGATLHAGYNQDAFVSSICTDLMKTIAAVDDLRFEHAKHLWAVLKNSERFSDSLDITLTENDLFGSPSYQTGMPYSPSNKEAFVNEDNSHLQNNWHNLKQLDAISSTLEELLERLSHEKRGDRGSSSD